MSYIEFPLPIEPVEPSKFALLEDIFLIGSIRILEKDSDKDNINPSTCKQGMLVRCMDSNKLYILKKFESGFDDYGDPIISNIEWEEFKVDVVKEEARDFTPSRLSLTISSLYPLGGSDPVLVQSFPISKAFIVSKVSVDTADIDFTLTETLVDNSLAFPYETFIHEIRDTNTTIGKDMTKNTFTFLDGTVLNTRYTQIFVNKDLDYSKMVYIKINRKNSLITKVKTTFTLIRLEGEV